MLTLGCLLLAGFFWLIGLPSWTVVLMLVLAGVAVFVFDLDDL